MSYFLKKRIKGYATGTIYCSCFFLTSLACISSEEKATTEAKITGNFVEIEVAASNELLNDLGDDNIIKGFKPSVPDLSSKDGEADNPIRKRTSHKRKQYSPSTRRPKEKSKERERKLTSSNRKKFSKTPAAEEMSITSSDEMLTNRVEHTLSAPEIVYERREPFYDAKEFHHSDDSATQEEEQTKRPKLNPEPEAIATPSKRRAPSYQKSRSLSHMTESFRSPHSFGAKEKPPEGGYIEKIEGTDLPWHVSNIAAALTSKDYKFFRALTLDDINKPEKSQKITEIGKDFDRTVNWLALQILMQPTGRERERLIKIFFMIGRLMFMHRNYQGTMYIIALFMKPSISHIMRDEKNNEVWKEVYLDDAHWKTIAVLGDHQKNNKAYRLLLAKNQPCLPILAHFLKDSIYRAEFLRLAPTPSAETAGLEKDNPAPPQLQDMLYESFPFDTTNDHEKFYTFFSNLPDTPEDLLDEFSCLRCKKELKGTKRELPPPNLQDWTASHLVYCLIENKCKDKVGFFFDDLKIWNGLQVVPYLESFNGLKNITENEKRKRLKSKLGVNTAVIDIFLSSLDKDSKNML